MPTTTNYIWDEDNLLTEADGTNAINTVCTNEPQQHGNLVSTRTGGTTSYHHFDALGSTRQLTNAVGHVTDSMNYDAWGNVVARTGATNVAFLWIGEVGYYSNSETGLIYVRRRAYEPAIARWTTIDPVEFVDGTNLFMYADNRPVLFIDPTGEFAWIPICCCTCAAALAIQFGVPAAYCLDAAIDIAKSPGGYIDDDRRHTGQDAISPAFWDCMQTYWDIQSTAHHVVASIWPVPKVLQHSS